MQADFSYEPVFDSAGFQLAITILADREPVRGQLREDAEAAGFRILECCSLDEFAFGATGALGDLVLVDCAEADAAAVALLSRLVMRPG